VFSLYFKLKASETIVYAVFEGGEFGMGALLHDGAIVHYADAVGFADGGQAVGDDDGGSALHEGIEGFLNLFFGFGIEAGGGFIEEEDSGVFEDGPGDGYALALATGEFDAAFADDGVEAFGEGGDELPGIGLIGGADDILIGGFGIAIADIIADGAAKEEHFLRYDGHIAAV